jgi:hypothetical protein
MSEEKVKTAEDLAIEKMQGGGNVPPIKPDESVEDKTDKTDKPVVSDGEKPVETPEVKPELSDYEKFSGGRFKTKEDFDAHLNDYDGIKTKATTLEKEVAELKKVSAANPRIDDAELIKIHTLSKKLNTKDYGLIGRLAPDNLSKMSDLDVVKMGTLMDDPDYKGREHILDRRLSEKYTAQKPSDYDDMDADEKKKYDLEAEDRAFELSKDAKKIRDKFATMWNDAEAELPKAKTDLELKEEYDKKVSDVTTKWRAPVEEIKTALGKIKLNIPVGKSKMDFEVEIPESMLEQQEQVLAMVVEHVFVGDIQPTAESINEVKSMAMNIFFINNKEYIMGQFAEKVRAMSEEQWRKSVINPSGLKEHDAGIKEQQLTPEEQQIAKLQGKA